MSATTKQAKQWLPQWRDDVNVCPQCGGRIQGSRQAHVNFDVEEQTAEDAGLGDDWDIYCENDCPEFRMENIEGSVSEMCDNIIERRQEMIDEHDKETAG